MAVAVTPNAVAPPLLCFGSQNGTHGVDCGSSIWRGGTPTHLFTRAPGGTCSTGGVGVAVGDGEAASDVEAPPPRPLPSCELCAGGAFWMVCETCGANS